MVGAILTQNTAWTNVEKAIRNLKRRKLLNFSSLNRAADRAVADAIRPAGFFRVKTRYLKTLISHIQTRHRGQIARFLAQSGEHLRAELLSIKGIGPETADSILLYAAHKPFFVVDAYTRRIFQRMGLLTGRESYEAVRRAFESAIPSGTRIYNEYHALIVRHAKETCRPRPLCGECALESGCLKVNAMIPDRKN